MDYECIRFGRTDHVGILSLNRPERLNAMNPQMFRELNHFFVQLGRDLQTRVVIVRGEGRAFCAGGDVKAAQGGIPRLGDEGDVQAHYHGSSQMASDVVTNMRAAPQPLIAAVRGSAAGGGFSMALACDLRIAGESARFNAAFTRIGLSGGDMGTSYHLQRIIGFARAAEYLYTGRFIDAATAERIGLVSRVVPDAELDATALDLAREMLQTSPFGLRLTKELLDFGASAATLQGALHLERRSQTLCKLTEDAKEGQKAFLEKRRPVWRDR